MPKVVSKKEKKSNLTIVKKMRDYSNDPFVIKKTEEAIEFLKKNPLPERFTKKGK